jgi:hypothetical protein
MPWYQLPEYSRTSFLAVPLPLRGVPLLLLALLLPLLLLALLLLLVLLGALLRHTNSLPSPFCMSSNQEPSYLLPSGKTCVPTPQRLLLQPRVDCVAVSASQSPV